VRALCFNDNNANLEVSGLRSSIFEKKTFDRHHQMMELRGALSGGQSSRSLGVGIKLSAINNTHDRPGG
jgi:hypothetical protein